MRTLLLSITMAAGLATGAHAAPLTWDATLDADTHARPTIVERVDYDDWRRHEWHRRDEWRRREAEREWLRHEEWRRRHAWREREREYGDGRY